MDKVTNDAHSHAHNHDHAHAHTDAHEPSTAATGASTIDPVCGMTVDPHKTPHRHAYHDHTYYFCGNGCRTKFAADPEKYLDKKTPAPEAPPGTIYTCPMHPQIVRSARAVARSAAWRSNRWSRPPRPDPIPRSPT